MADRQAPSPPRRGLACGIVSLNFGLGGYVAEFKAASLNPVPIPEGDAPCPCADAGGPEAASATDPVEPSQTHVRQERPMNRIAAVALIFSMSCAGGVAFAGAVSPMISGKAAVSFSADLSVIQVKGTAKSKTSTTTAPKATSTPKPVAPRPSLYSGPDYDNVLGLGNYMMAN